MNFILHKASVFINGSLSKNYFWNKLGVLVLAIDVSISVTVAWLSKKLVRLSVVRFLNIICERNLFLQKASAFVFDKNFRHSLSKNIYISVGVLGRTKS